MANIFVAAAATWNGKALKTAKKDVSAFDKQVKKLGTTLLGVFSARALYNYSKNAVKAFAADEKAARSLEQQLKNTGFAFSAPGVELYIANLQKATGVLDDELRPAFQQLLTITGSIGKSQDALNTALNVSAGTGKSLSQVTQALSRAYAGNTQGLSRLGAGLDKALLKAGDMDAIMAKLNEKFSGQAAARLETYAGKMDLLQVASENVKEEIGKGILDALTLLSRDTSIQSATSSMEDFGTSIGDAIYGMAKLIKKVEDLGIVSKSGGLANLLLSLQPGGRVGKLAFDALSKSGARPRELPVSEQRSASRIYVQQLKQEKRVADALAKARAEELRLLGLKNNIENKNVKELEKKFDLERIGITQALNTATDDETKLRLKAQLAILDNNEAMAKKLLAELEAYEALKKLAEQARLAGMSLEDFALFKVKTLNTKIDDYLQNTALEMVRALNAQIASFIASLGGVTGINTSVSTNVPGSTIIGTTGGSIFDPSFARRGESKDLTITIDTAQTGDRFAALIAESLQIAQKSGVSYGIAGGL
jgi:hypothetical protein